MNIEQIHKGDIVRFRQWEDMEQEFGVNDRGSIDCLYHFTHEMKPFCGMTFRVKGIDHNYVYLADDSGFYERELADYNISADMLEEATKEYEAFESKELDTLLGI